MASSASRKMKKTSLALAAALMLHGAALGAGPVHKDLYDRATQARPEVLKLLESLVNIDSGTGSEKGLDRVGALVADEAKKLGMQVEFSSAAPAIGKNLVATKRRAAESCKTNLFFGFFFDGTKNNYVQAEKTKSHSNVARLYDCYPGLSVPGVLPEETDWKYKPKNYRHFF